MFTREAPEGRDRGGERKPILAQRGGPRASGRPLSARHAAGAERPVPADGRPRAPSARGAPGAAPGAAAGARRGAPPGTHPVARRRRRGDGRARHDRRWRRRRWRAPRPRRRARRRPAARSTAAPGRRGARQGPTGRSPASDPPSSAACSTSRSARVGSAAVALLPREPMSSTSCTASWKAASRRRKRGPPTTRNSSPRVRSPSTAATSRASSRDSTGGGRRPRTRTRASWGRMRRMRRCSSAQRPPSSDRARGSRGAGAMGASATGSLRNQKTPCSQRKTSHRASAICDRRVSRTTSGATRPSWRGPRPAADLPRGRRPGHGAAPPRPRGRAAADARRSSRRDRRTGSRR